MAHAAPTVPTRHGRTPHTRHLSGGALAAPLLLGLVYGVWAAFIHRHMGPVDVGNVFYGILCGAVFAVCMVALARVGPRLKREVHAASYGVFAGVAVGYLHSLTNGSVLRSAGIGLAVAAGVGVVMFYRYYTHEE
ncbi:hypothetical protein [Streptomyces sp. NPDC051567]|uniref:hypothetical protein n=1 Tax=Streptomyces sp. NPDC051567 TaxID=3365660 RepID=UPI0037AC44C6